MQSGFIHRLWCAVPVVLMDEWILIKFGIVYSYKNIMNK